MGDILWKRYSNIPDDSICNMDELGMDMTKHRSKVLQKKQIQPLKNMSCHVNIQGKGPWMCAMAYHCLSYNASRWYVACDLLFDCCVFD